MEITNRTEPKDKPDWTDESPVEAHTQEDAKNIIIPLECSQKYYQLSITCDNG